MPSDLREHQYELLAVDSTAEGLVFGTEDTGYLTINRPVITSGDVGANDSSRPLEDGVMFSRDTRGAKSIAFEIGVLTDVNNAVLAPVNTAAAYAMNLDYLEAFEGWWTDPAWRRTARSLAMLRICEAGRVTRCYGRPRRYDEVVGKITQQGYSNVVCDFQMIDGTFYDDDEDHFDMTLYEPPTSGLVTPLITPLTTTRENYLSEVMTVGGKQPTWLIAEFKGPVTNPRVEIGDMTIALNGVVPAGQTYVVDPRPWVRSAYRKSDGAGVGGMIARQTPALRNLKIEPGAHTAKYIGTGGSGVTSLRLRWRDARARP